MALPETSSILYTTSLGEHTRPVFRRAVQQAIANNAKIYMLHVVEPIGEMGHALIQNYLPEDLIKKLHDEGIEEIKAQMKKRVESFCEDELSSLPERPTLDIEMLVEEGQLSDCILAAAKEHQVDMIVLGNENRFGHHSHTPQYVNRQSKVPVLVVPTGKKFA